MGPKDAASGGAIRRAAIIFLPLAVVAAAVMFLLHRAQISASQAILASVQTQMVELARQRLLGTLGPVVSDVAYLSKQKVLQEWLASGGVAGRRVLAAEYLAFAAQKAVYDQVRLIDLKGREVVRVNWNDGMPAIVPDDELLDVVGRYYAQETLKLGPGQVYVSRFDLNVERSAVEEPLEPVIRFGVPVFDADGRKRGAIVLNYLGQLLLDRLAVLDDDVPGEIWLLNADGYWLLGPRAEEGWGFMHPDAQSRTVAEGYPRAWTRILTASGSSQFEIGGEVFTHAEVHPTEVRNAPAAGFSAEIESPDSWILLAHLSVFEIATATATATRNFVLALCGLLLVLAVVSWLLARHWAARRRSEQAVRASEARFRGLLESAPDGVVVTDADGGIVYVNAQTERLFGYRRDDLAGRKIEMLVPARHRERHIQHRTDYIADPHPRSLGGEGMDLHGERSDGTEFPAALSLSPVDTPEGLRVFAAVRDISDWKQAERQLRELADRLSRDNAELDVVNRELEAFSYSVSHDLRAPLRAIDGFSQALMEDCAGQLNDDGHAHLGRVRQAAQRMGLLIDDLLKLARVSRAELTIEEVDLSSMAQDITNALRQGAPDRPAAVVIAPGLLVEGDARLLRVALENLLGNAWKFTVGRTPACIEFGRSGADGAASFFVRDDGVGFDMAYSGKLFGAFQRLHDVTEFPGTGIGLATVQRIIHKHGGRIWAEAEPGKGATFHFTLSTGGDS